MKTAPGALLAWVPSVFLKESTLGIKGLARGQILAAEMNEFIRF